MQHRFPASQKILPNVLREIRKAKRNHELVVKVQYGYRSQSLRAITKLLRNCKHLTVTKDSDDGATAIYNALIGCFHANNLGSRKINLGTIKKLRVCGVNTSACVIKTVESLSFLRWPVEVISDACANNLGKSETLDQRHQKISIQIMKTWRNVKVL